MSVRSAWRSSWSRSVGLVDAVGGLREDGGDRGRSGLRRGELGRVEVQEHGEDAAVIGVHVGEPPQAAAGERCAAMRWPYPGPGRPEPPGRGATGARTRRAGVLFRRKSGSIGQGELGCAQDWGSAP